MPENLTLSSKARDLPARSAENEQGAAVSPAGAVTIVTTGERTELAQRMLRDAIDQSSPVLAMLQLNGADLLEMGSILKEAIIEAAQTCGKLAELRELQSSMETCVQLSRQADRVLRLRHEMTEASE